MRKKSKYNNRKTVVDGITFDSKKEAEYYLKYKMLKKAGQIKDIELQPRFELQPKYKRNGKTVRAITYVADFKITWADDRIEIIDVKGSKAFQTQVYKLKKKMFEYRYPELSIVEKY